MPQLGSNSSRESPWLPAPRWVVAVGLLAIAFAVAAAVASATPPRARPATAPEAAFSAARVRSVLERIYADVGPHPMGSSANAQVRARIEKELRAIGLQPQHRRHMVCGSVSCGWVDNIVARVEGEQPGPAVMLSCHYDSVPAGPGVGDDGSGVGIAIEVARALLSGPPPKHPVILLIDDGEEAGLFGARGFVAENPSAQDVAVVVNVEARGTRGVSNMFETKGATRWMLEPYLQRAPHPRVSSLATTIYERMPNDTDLTVFGDAGLPGLNFAFVGGGSRYHTPRDDLEHLSWSSVQHQGGEALAAVRALANLERLEPSVQGEDVFETILGRVVLRWPRRWSLGLALGVLVVTLIGIGVGMLRGRIRLAGLIAAVFGLLLALVASLAVLWLLTLTFDAWVPMPVRFSSRAPTLMLGWSLVVAGVIVLVASLLARWVRGLEALAAYVLGAAAIAVGIAGVVPAASGIPIAVAGGMMLGLLAAAHATRPTIRLVGLLLGTALPLAVALDLSIALHNTFGSGISVVPMAVVALATIGAVPWVLGVGGGREPAYVGAGTLFTGCIVMALGMATLAYDHDHPYPVDFVLVRDAREDTAQWWAMAFNGPPPPSMLDGGFETRTEPVLLGYAGHPGPASSLAMQPGLEFAELQRPAQGGGTIRGRVRSARGSTLGQLRIGPAHRVTAVRVAGRIVAGRSVRSEGAQWITVRLHGLPGEGTPVEIDTPAAEELRIVTVDVQFGLPSHDEVRRVTALRPSWSAPLQFGDVDLVLTEVPR